MDDTTPNPTDLSQSIADTAVSPSEVNIDGQMAKGQPVGDLIAADRYLASKRAAAVSPFATLQRAIGVPPGTVSRNVGRDV